MIRDVRILFCADAGTGHVLPLLPLARAARARGHDVAIGVGASMAPAVEAARFRHAELGPPSIEQVVADIPGIESLSGRRRALTIWREAFSRRIASEMAKDVLRLADAGGWRPDLIVHEDAELGSWIAAERLGIPHATVQTTAWRPWIWESVASNLAELRARHGLVPDPGLTGLSGAVFFTTRPASMRDPAQPLPEPWAELRPEADDRVGSPLGDVVPDWLAGDADEPLPRVAVTLGTANAHRTDVVRILVDGLTAIEPPVQVVVGLGADPSTLGPVPPSVRVESYVPMSVLLPRSQVVVCHGGSGTMLAALATGVPLLMVPLAADQPDNADQCQRAGVALVLNPLTLSEEAVKEATERLLTDPTFRTRAAALAAEIAAMPGPAEAVIRLESLVAAEA